MATVRLLLGTSRSRRAEAMDDMLLAHWGRARLIVPTRRFAERRLVAALTRGNLQGVLGRPVVTFQERVYLVD